MTNRPIQEIARKSDMGTEAGEVEDEVGVVGEVVQAERTVVAEGEGRIDPEMTSSRMAISPCCNDPNLRPKPSLLCQLPHLAQYRRQRSVPQ